MAKSGMAALNGMSNFGAGLKKAFQKLGQYLEKLGQLFSHLKTDLIMIWRVLRRVVAFVLPGGRVSRIHYYEAKERYESLRCMLNHYKNKNEPAIDSERMITIQECDSLLAEAKMFITRKQKDLNILWRKLTRVRIMLVEEIMLKELLPTELDFCREEAFRLDVEDDAEIKKLLERLSELLHVERTDIDVVSVRRRIRALLERFNTIRTGNIHQQFINIRTYQLLLLMLLLIAVPLINSWELILFGKKAGPVTAAVNWEPMLPEPWGRGHR